MHKMKRFLSILLALVMLMGMLPAGSVFAEDGDITEEPTTTTESTATTESATTESTTTTGSTEASEEPPEEEPEATLEPSGPNHVLRIPKDIPNSNFHMYNAWWHDLPTGDKYKISFRARGHGYVRVTFSQWGNSAAEGYTADAYLDDDDWVSYEGLFEGTDYNQSACLIIYANPGNAGDVYLDDISVKRVDADGNPLPDAGEMVFGGDFESGIDGRWNTSNWGLSQIIEEEQIPEYVPDPEPPVNNALRIPMVGGQDHPRGYQWVSGLAQNQNHVAGIWVKGDGKINFRIFADWGSNLATLDIQATDTWTLHTLEFNSGTNESVCFALYDTVTEGNYVLVDDAFLAAEGSGDNLLQNPGFTGDNSDNCWHFEGQTDSWAFEPSDDPASSKVLRIANRGGSGEGGSVFSRNGFKLTPSTQYTINFKAKGHGQMRVTLSDWWLNDKIRSREWVVDSDENWQDYTYTFTSDAWFNWGVLAFVADLGNRGDVFIKDVTVTDGTGENVIRNGDFRYGELYWGGAYDANWSVIDEALVNTAVPPVAGIEPAEYLPVETEKETNDIVNSQDVHSGNGYAKITTRGHTVVNRMMVSWVDGLVGGQQYELSVWVKGEGEVELRFLEGGKRYMCHGKALIQNADTEVWTKHTVLWTCPYGLGGVDVAVVDNGETSGSVLLFDDFSLTPVNEPNNNRLGGNPGFENGDNWWVGSGIYFERITIPSLIEEETRLDVNAKHVHDGSHSMKMVTTGNSYKLNYMTEGNSLEAGEYEFSFWMKGDGDVTIKFRDGDAASNPNYAEKWFGSDVGYRVSGKDNVWTRYTIPFEVVVSEGENNPRLDCCFFDNVASTVGSTLYFDELKLVKKGQDTNLLTNPSLESGWDNWYSETDYSNITIYEHNNPNTNNVLAVAPEANLIMQWPWANDGKTCTISFRIIGKGEVRITSKWCDETITATREWETKEVTFTAGEDSNADITITRVSGEGTVYIDDFTVKGSDGVEMVANGCFENGTDDWSNLGTDPGFTLVLEKDIVIPEEPSEPDPSEPTEPSEPSEPTEPSEPIVPETPGTAVTFTDGVFVDDLSGNDKFAETNVSFHWGDMRGPGHVVYKLDQDIKGFYVDFDTLGDVWNYTPAVEGKPGVFAASFDGEKIVRGEEIETLQIFRSAEVVDSERPKFRYVSADPIPVDIEYLWIEMPGENWFQANWAYDRFALTNVEIHSVDSDEVFYDYTIDIADQAKSNYDAEISIDGNNDPRLGRPGGIAAGTGKMTYYNENGIAHVLIQSVFGSSFPVEDSWTKVWVSKDGADNSYTEVKLTVSAATEMTGKKDHVPATFTAELPAGTKYIQVSPNTWSRVLTVAYAVGEGTGTLPDTSTKVTTVEETKATINAEDMYDGVYSLKLDTRSGDGYWANYHDSDLATSTRYELSFWVKGEGSASIDFRQAGNFSLVHHDPINIEGKANVWTQYTISFVTPEIFGTNEKGEIVNRLDFVIFDSGAEGKTLYFDGFSLVLASDANKTNLLTNSNLEYGNFDHWWGSENAPFSLYNKEYPGPTVAFDENGVFTDELNNTSNVIEVTDTASIAKFNEQGYLLGSGHLVYKLNPADNLKGVLLDVDCLDSVQMLNVEKAGIKVYTAGHYHDGIRKISEINMLQLFRSDEIVDGNKPMWRFISADPIPDGTQYLLIELPEDSWFGGNTVNYYQNFALNTVKLFSSKYPDVNDKFGCYKVDITNSQTENFTEIEMAKEDNHYGRGGKAAYGTAETGWMHYADDAGVKKVIVQTMYENPSFEAAMPTSCLSLDVSADGKNFVSLALTAENVQSPAAMTANTEYTPITFAVDIPANVTHFRVHPGAAAKVLTVAYVPGNGTGELEGLVLPTENKNQVLYVTTMGWSTHAQLNDVPKYTNKEYTITFKAKGNANISVTMVNSDWQRLAELRAGRSDDWKEYSFTVNPGEYDGWRSIVIYADTGYVGGPGYEAKTYIDDFTITVEGETWTYTTADDKTGDYNRGSAGWPNIDEDDIVFVPYVKPPLPTEGFIVDQYGQKANMEYEGKIHNDEEFEAAAVKDQEFWDSLRIEVLADATLDEYGGLKDSGLTLCNTEGCDAGYFHIHTVTIKDQKKSVMVDPLGNLFFNNGPNGAGYVEESYTQVSGREDAYQWLPDRWDDPKFAAAWHEGGHAFSFYIANYIRKYGSFDPDSYAETSAERLKLLGFTTAGAWSVLPTNEESVLPHYAWLTLPDYYIGDSGLYDIFHPQMATEMDAKFAQLQNLKDDKKIIAYLFANELHYHKLKSAVPAANGNDCGSKAELISVLKEKYGADEAGFAAWAEAWGYVGDANITSWNAANTGNLQVRTQTAVEDMDSFTQHYLDILYKTIATTAKKYDPNHMIAGDRWLGAVMQDSKLRGYLCTAAGKYLDVLSYNYYTYDIDMNMLSEMYRQSGGKPFIFTEFHYGEPTSGLTFGLRMAKDEVEKGLMYKNYVEKAAASGMVVGTNWFIYLDQPATGRHFDGVNGEAGAIGLLDVTDRAYQGFLEHVIEANANVYDLILGNIEPYQHEFPASQVGRSDKQILYAPHLKDAPTTIKIGDFTDWDVAPVKLGEANQVLGSIDPSISADMKVMWDDTYFYFQAHVKDPTPLENRDAGPNGAPSWMWDGDCIELFFGPTYVDEGGTMKYGDNQVLLGGCKIDGTIHTAYYWNNPFNVDNQPEIDVKAKIDDDGKGYWIEATIKLSDIGVTEVTNGTRIRYDMGFNEGISTGRQRQYYWNGVDGNSSNREKWGMLELVHKESIDEYRTGDQYTVPKRTGRVFAGWFKDPGMTVSIGPGQKTGMAYAKFVDAEVLSVKYQLATNVTQNPEHTAIRMLTTVDNLNYHLVGFAITINGVTRDVFSNTVYSFIMGYRDGYNQEYPPTIFSPESNYFMALRLNGIPNSYFDKPIHITPVWITLDGTRVEGIPNTVVINEAIEELKEGG